MRAGLPDKERVDISIRACCRLALGDRGRVGAADRERGLCATCAGFDCAIHQHLEQKRSSPGRLSLCGVGCSILKKSANVSRFSFECSRAAL